ncbi:MAG: hypothetical protein ACOCVX_04840 [Bacteroidales bacterium]|jgi:CDP-diglyceride synthetase
MKEFFKKHKFAILLTLAGLVAGWLYYYYVGCLTGTCPLQKLWYYDMALGGLLGMVVGDLIDARIKKRKPKQNDDENTDDF